MNKTVVMCSLFRADVSRICEVAKSREESIINVIMIYPQNLGAFPSKLKVYSMAPGDDMYATIGVPHHINRSFYMQ